MSETKNQLALILKGQKEIMKKISRIEKEIKELQCEQGALVESKIKSELVISKGVWFARSFIITSLVGLVKLLINKNHQQDEKDIIQHQIELANKLIENDGKINPLSTNTINLNNWIKNYFNWANLQRNNFVHGLDNGVDLDIRGSRILDNNNIIIEFGEVKTVINHIDKVRKLCNQLLTRSLLLLYASKKLGFNSITIIPIIYTTSISEKMKTDLVKLWIDYISFQSLSDDQIFQNGDPDFIKASLKGITLQIERI